MGYCVKVAHDMPEKYTLCSDGLDIFRGNMFEPDKPGLHTRHNRVAAIALAAAGVVAGFSAVLHKASQDFGNVLEGVSSQGIGADLATAGETIKEAGYASAALVGGALLVAAATKGITALRRYRKARHVPRHAAAETKTEPTLAQLSESIRTPRAQLLQWREQNHALVGTGTEATAAAAQGVHCEFVTAAGTTVDTDAVVLAATYAFPQLYRWNQPTNVLPLATAA